MGRPQKPRRVSAEPKTVQFCAVSQEAGSGCCRARIVLLVEEYEVIRLLDYMGMTQDECAAQMRVSRATVQALYCEARKKVSRFLVEGTGLEIAGGNYVLCREKGEGQMKIAVTYENGEVFQHFGHTEQFKVYTVENGAIVSAEVIDTNGSGHGALAGFLRAHGVDALICGGIGGGARNALADAGIELYPGASGNADVQVESFLGGKLNYNPDTVCAHHHGQEEGHDCGGHSHSSCGSSGHGSETRQSK